jgi:thiol-disulfide isomerase/thioredoxin
MKKQLLAIALLTSSWCSAQTWSENFSSAVVPGLPANWMQNNVDGKTPDASLAAYNFGSNAWVTRDITAAFNYPASYGRCAVSTSWFNPVGVADRWIISPSFTVPTNAVLVWEAMTVDPQFSDGYELRISTTGTTVSSFTTNPNLFSTNAENINFTQRGVSLDAYAGQTVNVAFRNNSNDKYILFLDNISCYIPANATDGNIVSINGLTRYLTGAGNQNVSGTFKQLGYATATTAVMNYNINNGPVVSQTINFAPSVPFFGNSAFTFSTQGNFALGTNNVKIWVSSVNGIPEAVNTNDTAYSVVFVASQSVTIKALIEEWTSSTCPPCATLNQTFDPLLANNAVNTGTSNVNAVKYQVNWPSPGNDPSYNQHVRDKVTHYAVNAAPTVKGNGGNMATNQAGIDAIKAMPAYANIVANITLSGDVLSASSTITPYVDIPVGSPIRVNQAVLQKYYDYPGASTSQKTYNHVMRKMFPNAWGDPINVSDGVPQTASFTHSITTAALPTTSGTTNFWSSTVTPVYEYVVWIQDTVSNQILQSASAKVSPSGVGIVELKNNSNIGVYPNPAKDFAIVGIRMNNPSVVEISITDISGRIVYSNRSEVEEGDSQIRINTSEFATGVYSIVVNTKDGILQEKLIIVK